MKRTVVFLLLCLVAASVRLVILQQRLDREAEVVANEQEQKLTRVPVVFYEDHSFAVAFTIPFEWKGGINEDNIDDGNFAIFRSENAAISASVKEGSVNLPEFVAEQLEVLLEKGGEVIGELEDVTINGQPCKVFRYLITMDYDDVNDVKQTGVRVYNSVAMTVKEGRLFNFVASIVVTGGESEQELLRYRDQTFEVLQMVRILQVEVKKKSPPTTDNMLST